MDITIVTGLSGAGKTTALHALEDLGAYCVDNLPLSMLGQLVERLSPHLERKSGVTDATKPTSLSRRLVVGIDARDPNLLERVDAEMDALREAGHEISVLFIEAPTLTLVRRYSETRRRHPLGELPGAIEREQTRLQPLRDASSIVINTEKLSARQLRRIVRERFGSKGQLTLVLTSFGFKSALPSEADGVFDVRFLANPYDVPDLRPRTGLERVVQDYVLQQPEAMQCLDLIESWIRFQVPLSLHEGRSSLTLAIGCTGGQHRSVTLVETIRQRFETQALPTAVRVKVRHRDIESDLYADEL